ncbi:hypothetical protein [Natronobacterium texcoconense]|uniref:hypothetical protein n=1 Tax=Natronobacterium texcoconense TaxID=1095778 RepID=UPI000B874FA2|nr:hypothetical protein [Natronobacterium texcoconense]
MFVYGAEVLLSLLLASGKALFAQQQPTEDRDGGVLTVSNGLLTEKRGRVQVVDWLPPIYLRNVSFSLVVLYVTPVYAFFFAAYLYAAFEVGWELLSSEVL